MSGTPVLSTNVGETSKYFKDGEHMYFAKPESPLDYANKLKYIIDNYEKALAVAKKGKMPNRAIVFSYICWRKDA